MEDEDYLYSYEYEQSLEQESCNSSNSSMDFTPSLSQSRVVVNDEQIGLERNSNVFEIPQNNLMTTQKVTAYKRA